MITIHIVYNENREVLGFQTSGHADYEEYGKDIVCAAVSALTINLINSTLELTSQGIITEVKEDGGLVKAKYENPVSGDAKLLFNSYLLGVQEIEETYGSEYIHIMDVIKHSNKNYEIINYQEV